VRLLAVIWQSFEWGAGNRTKVINDDGNNIADDNGNMLYVDNDMLSTAAQGS